MGRLDQKIAFIWGALPGEDVEFRIIKKKKQFVEGVITKVFTSAVYRELPREEHYLICSPWQTIQFAEENTWKIKIAKETYLRLGDLAAPDDLQIFTDGVEYNYRNKLEFSFTTNESGMLSLGFHERGSLWKTVAVPGCALGTNSINTTAPAIVTWLQSQSITSKQMKSVIVRSNQQGQTIAALFLKDRLAFSSFPIRPPEWLGFQIYFSNPLSPASVPTELVYSDGDVTLTDDIDGKKCRYGLLSFFQINVPVFLKAVSDIGTFIEPGSKVVDYYSGVGSIGISIAAKCSELTLVENNNEAAAFAAENITRNGLKTVKVSGLAAEQEAEPITKESVVIIDPPRIGLHKKMVEVLLNKQPRRIIYLSCDLATQARDVRLLTPLYQPVFWKLYNFFPKTPHIEGLIILERRG